MGKESITLSMELAKTQSHEFECFEDNYSLTISMQGCRINTRKFNRVFSHDVTAAILVSQNNEMAAMLVSQTSPVGVELLSYANTFFCSKKFA